MNPFKRVFPSVILLFFIIVIGTSGYMIIEGWSFIDAIYMMVITLFTIGFKEANELSTNGRIFTIFVIICGVGTAVYAAGKVVEIIVEGHLLDYNRRKKMKKKINTLKNHYIICGFGRVGKQVAEEFNNENISYIVVDRQETIKDLLAPKGIPFIVGDIILDENLIKAGIKNAKGLIANADSDVANVFVTLSARALNPDLYIVARASDSEGEEKVKTAGADRVISPYFISGRKIATSVLNPIASDYLDILMYSKDVGFNFREISVIKNSSLENRRLGDIGIREKTGVIIMAIHKKNRTFNLQPTPSCVLDKNDTLVVIGTTEQLRKLDVFIKQLLF